MCPDAWVPLWRRYGWLDPLMCPACTSERLIIWITHAPNITSFGTSGGNAHHLNAGRELLLKAVAWTQLLGQGRCARPNDWTVPALDSHGQSLACLHAPTGEPRVRAARFSDFLTPRPPGPLARGWRADRSGGMPAPAPCARRLPASSLRPPVPGPPWLHAPDSLLWIDSVLQWRDADPPRLPARSVSARRAASPPSAP